MRAHAEGGQQYLPRERRNVTHVSRLQSVQAAVEAQIKKISRESPDKKVTDLICVCVVCSSTPSLTRSAQVGLVTFNNEVTLIGDGMQDPITVAGDKLDSWQELWTVGSKFPLRSSARDAESALLKRLWDLEENGATALGPALLLGIAIAGAAPGSSVILCTDGLANQGLGSLEGKEKEMTAFYTECAEQAVLKGVTVSVISLIGAEARLEQLSVLAEKTSGSTDRVDPRRLANQLDAIVGGPPIVAYGAMAMVLIHRGLRFRGEMDDEQEQRFWVVKDLGNVTAQSECTVSYAFRPKEEVDLSGVREIPFQVQLLYTRPDGSVRLRVATATIALTDDRAEAEKKADVAIIGAHAAQHAARLAKAGDYESAQLEARAAQRFLQRNAADNSAALEVFSEQMENMDGVLRSERKKEPMPANMRNKSRDDEAAAAISKATKANTNMLK